MIGCGDWIFSDFSDFCIREKILLLVFSTQNGFNIEWGGSPHHSHCGSIE